MRSEGKGQDKGESVDNVPEHKDPVSLAPLTPEEALRALLAVKPDSEAPDDDHHPDEDR